ncbi:MAG: chromosome partitioning protein ParB, partial [Rhodococcus sp. (in: high G+C Gram-positive bacteria)]
MAKRTGLGRGIGALIPTSEASDDRPSDVFFPRAVATEDVSRETSVRSNGDEASDAPVATDDLVAVPGARLAHIDPHAIVPNPRQPRTHFKPEDLAELVHSVRE